MKENIFQYVDLSPTLINVLKKQKYAHSLFAPRRFGKSVFLQMMRDFGMRTIKSSKEYYSDNLAHLQIFQPSTDISVLTGYDQPLFIPYIQLVHSKSYQDQQKKAFQAAAGKFLQFRDQDSQQVIKGRDYHTKKMIELCQMVYNHPQRLDQFVNLMKNFQERTIIIVDEYDKALFPQDGDPVKKINMKLDRRQELAAAIQIYKGQVNIIVSGVLKLSQLGINSGINHFTQFVTDGHLGPQPLGFTKTKIKSDKIKLNEIMRAAFQYRSSKSKPLYINARYLLPNVEQHYQDEDIQKKESDNFDVQTKLRLTFENFIEVVFQLYDGYRMTLKRSHLKEQTSIPATIIWKSIGAVLNTDKQEFPTTLWIESTESKYIKEVASGTSSQEMDLFKILRDDSRVEIEESFLRQSIDSPTEDKHDSEVIRKRFISMLYYGGYLTVKGLTGGNKVVLGPPNLTVFQNLLKMFSHIGTFLTLNQNLKLYWSRSIPVPDYVWENSLKALNEELSGVRKLQSAIEQKRQLNLTSNIARVLSSRIPDFIVFHQLQTSSGKKPDIIIAEKSTKKKFIILQYLISDFFKKTQFENHVNRDYQNEYQSAKEQITVLVDKKDMKTILMAKVKRKNGQEKFIIDSQAN